MSVKSHSLCKAIMNFKSVLIVASACIVLTMIGAEGTNSMGSEFKLLDSKKYSNSLLSIERHDSLLRKKRNAFLNNAQNTPVAKRIDLEEIDNMLPVDTGYLSHHEGEITKRHACRYLRNRWNSFRSGYEYNKNRDKVEKKDFSEESEEVNTEDPSYIASAEISENKEENKTEKPRKVKDDRQRKDKNHGDTDKKSKNAKSEEDEAKDKKSKDSGENADNEEFIFMKAPAVAAAKENKNRKDDNRKRRVERDIIEEENVATTASGYKFTSGYGDFGSKVSFRNINV